MNQTFRPLQPKVILAIGAHPDDLDVPMAGTIAKYVAEGATAYYYILTNANKGSEDPDISCDELRDMRRAEQRAAGKAVGLSDIFFGDYEDATLKLSMTLKRDIVRQIRTLKPDVVLTLDPTCIYEADLGLINHPDHRICGQAVLDAVYPLARDHLSFPELLTKEKLEPHKVTTVLLHHIAQQNFYVDITPYMAQKEAAIRAHASQFPEPDSVLDMVHQWATKAGVKVGARYAESFVRIDVQG